MQPERRKWIFGEYPRTRKTCFPSAGCERRQMINHKTSEGLFPKGSNQQQARKATKPKLTHVTLYMWWLSEEERRVDALALRADERRDKLRKAAGRSKYPLIRRCLNGETRQSKPLSSIRQSITYGGEPGELKHLSSRRKRKKHRFPK